MDGYKRMWGEGEKKGADCHVDSTLYARVNTIDRAHSFQTAG